jgi:arsenate reductase
VSPASVLFICLGNTCRSPMAEAIARAIGGDRIVAYSAGLTPTGRVAAGTLNALQRLGYPTAGLASKGLDDVPLEEMDVIVSLVGPDGLRLLPASLTAARLSWSLRDPYGDDDTVYDAVARRLEVQVRDLLDELSRPPLR